MLVYFQVLMQLEIIIKSFIPNEINPQLENENEEQAKQQKIIDTCLEILEKNERDEQEEDQTETKEIIKNLEIKDNQSIEKINNQEDHPKN